MSKTNTPPDEKEEGQRKKGEKPCRRRNRPLEEGIEESQAERLKDLAKRQE